MGLWNLFGVNSRSIHMVIRTFNRVISRTMYDDYQNFWCSYQKVNWKSQILCFPCNNNLKTKTYQTKNVILEFNINPNLKSSNWIVLNSKIGKKNVEKYQILDNKICISYKLIRFDVLLLLRVVIGSFCCISYTRLE